VTSEACSARKHSTPSPQLAIRILPRFSLTSHQAKKLCDKEEIMVLDLHQSLNVKLLLVLALGIRMDRQNGFAIGAQVQYSPNNIFK
jgi:hypothetical protein